MTSNERELARGVDHFTHLRAHQVERTADPLVGSRSLIEDYLQFRSEVQIKVRVRGVDGQGSDQLAIVRPCRRIHAGARDEFDDVGCRHLMCPVVRINEKPDQVPVLVNVLKLSEGPEWTCFGRIPSHVWLEGPDKRLGVLVSVGKSGPAASVERFLGQADGECEKPGILRQLLPDSGHVEFREPIDEVVETGPEVVQTLTRFDSKRVLNPDGCRCVVAVLRSVVIGFTPKGMVTRLVKAVDCIADPPRVGTRPIESELNPGKWVG